MADGPGYTTVPGKLPELLKKVREAGVPGRASNAWLESLGFKSTNDRSMLTVLRQIGFLDPSGAPTPAWKEYRGADHKAVLGRAIQLGYEDLYGTYPDAHSRPSADLGHVFSTRTSAGKQTVDKMVSTFKSLVTQAEFGTLETVLPVATPSGAATGMGATAATVVASTTRNAAGLSVNINVQLTLPETTDESVYEAFFKAMRKHLLSDDA
jgi:hypothetical protein